MTMWLRAVPLLLLFTYLGSTSAKAQERSPIAPPITSPTIVEGSPQTSPDLKALLAGKSVPGAITSATPSPVYSSVPSLWWISEQIAALEEFGDKLIQEWIAYPSDSGSPGRVDLLVNRQLWSLLDYLQRYEFVNRFSAIARSYGYSTRVYDNPDRSPVALYTCNFSTAQAQVLEASPQVKQPTAYTRNPIADQANCKLLMNSTIRVKKPAFR